MTSTRRVFPSSFPTDCWYAVAAAHEVGRNLLPVRAVGSPVVLYRTEAGAAIALRDRCAHRAYPLSAGSLVGDEVVCGLCGFVYDSGGQCVSVPTQPRVPLGAHVDSFPTQERDGLVWVWFGEPGRARLHRTPGLPWLADPAWSTVGGVAELSAGYLLLHENFADVTQVPFVAPEIAPSVLTTAPPPLEVVVTETTVELRRDFPPAPLPGWQRDMLGAEIGPLTTQQRGFFLSPAAWVDYWDAVGDNGFIARLRFTHLVTPVERGRSRLHWRVSRDFAVGDESANELTLSIFADYYARVGSAMETAQGVLDTDGPAPEVNVAADAAALKVREIVLGMLEEEGTLRPKPARRASVPS